MRNTILQENTKTITLYYPNLRENADTNANPNVTHMYF